MEFLEKIFHLIIELERERKNNPAFTPQDAKEKLSKLKSEFENLITELHKNLEANERHKIEAIVSQVEELTKAHEVLTNLIDDHFHFKPDLERDNPAATEGFLKNVDQDIRTKLFHVVQKDVAEAMTPEWQESNDMDLGFTPDDDLADLAISELENDFLQTLLSDSFLDPEVGHSLLLMPNAMERVLTHLNDMVSSENQKAKIIARLNDFYQKIQAYIVEEGETFESVGLHPSTLPNEIFEHNLTVLRNFIEQGNKRRQTPHVPHPEAVKAREGISPKGYDLILQIETTLESYIYGEIDLDEFNSIVNALYKITFTDDELQSLFRYSLLYNDYYQNIADILIEKIFKTIESSKNSISNLINLPIPESEISPFVMRFQETLDVIRKVFDYSIQRIDQGIEKTEKKLENIALFLQDDEGLSKKVTRQLKDLRRAKNLLEAQIEKLNIDFSGKKLQETFVNLMAELTKQIQTHWTQPRDLLGDATRVLISQASPLIQLLTITHVLSIPDAVVKMIEDIDFTTLQGRNLLANLGRLYDTAIHLEGMGHSNSQDIKNNLLAIEQLLQKDKNNDIVFVRIEYAYMDKNYINSLTEKEKILKSILDCYISSYSDKTGIDKFVIFANFNNEVKRILGFSLTEKELGMMEDAFKRGKEGTNLCLQNASQGWGQLHQAVLQQVTGLELQKVLGDFSQEIGLKEKLEKDLYHQVIALQNQRKQPHEILRFITTFVEKTKQQDDKTIAKTQIGGMVSQLSGSSEKTLDTGLNAGRQSFSTFEMAETPPQRVDELHPFTTDRTIMIPLNPGMNVQPQDHQYGSLVPFYHDPDWIALSESGAVMMPLHQTGMGMPPRFGSPTIPYEFMPLEKPIDLQNGYAYSYHKVRLTSPALKVQQWLNQAGSYELKKVVGGELLTWTIHADPTYRQSNRPFFQVVSNNSPAKTPEMRPIIFTPNRKMSRMIHAPMMAQNANIMLQGWVIMYYGSTKAVQAMQDYHLDEYMPETAQSVMATHYLISLPAVGLDEAYEKWRDIKQHYRYRLHEMADSFLTPPKAETLALCGPTTEDIRNQLSILGLLDGPPPERNCFQPVKGGKPKGVVVLNHHFPRASAALAGGNR